jgi:hypothetical protein
MEGIDFSYGSGTTVAQIKNAGKGFVCRYLSGGGSKDISKAELSNYVGGGIAVVLVWELGANRMNQGAAAGKADATKANQQAIGLGAGTIPIYFAADWDASAAQQANINAYLDGAAGVIGRGRVGVYGSYYVVKRAFDAGKITFGWQTYAWSGGQWDSRAQLQQYKNDIKIAGVPAQLDLDRSMKADFGQWPRPGATTPPPAPAPPAGGQVPALGVDWFGIGHNATAPAVRTWQQKMKDRGWNIAVDGTYGPKSQAVCRSFQSEKHLAVDGKVGPQTWQATWTSPVT